MAKAKAKLPKRVAGVKVPKKLRRQAKQAFKLTGTGAVRDLALAGLTLAAERALASMQSGSTKKKARANLDALDLGEVVRAAAAEGARRFLEGFEEATVAAARPRRPAKPKAAAKPKPAARPAKPAKAAAPAKAKARPAKPAKAARPARTAAPAKAKARPRKPRATA